MGVHLKSWDWSSDTPYVLLTVAGPEKTPFEGGRFEVEIRCSPTWPSLWFKTKVWHPKVCSTTGEVFPLSEESFGIHTLLYLGQDVQKVLANPQPENPKNPEAARQCRDDVDEFNRTAREWTARYAKLLGQKLENNVDVDTLARVASLNCNQGVLDLCPVDHQALLDLFLANHNPTATATKHGWGFGVTSLSGWYYALSSHDNGRLACLNLSSHDLKGELTPSVGKFVALTHLYLARNSLTGAIPRELCNVQTLQFLDLSSNQLEGCIPEHLGDLHALRVLCLTQNRLTGTIPRELCSVETLQFLDLSSNQLEGPIPEHLGDLYAFRVLNLSHNRLTGTIPKELCNAQGLQVLVLSSNQLEGPIPEHIGDLHALRVLDLSYNRLTGVLPSTLSKISSLTYLLLQGNKLTGLWDHTEDCEYEQSAAPGGDQARYVPDVLSQLLDFIASLQIGSVKWVDLDDNPWTEPPETIVKKGMKASREYFEALYADHFSVRRTNLKVVLVGHGGAGKTSLRQSIREQRPTPTEGAIESTVHIDVENLELDGTTVRFYDCAGQVAYTGLLQTFLTPRSLILLVCDAAAFGQRNESLDYDSQLKVDIRSLDNLRICDWLRSLSFRIPHSAVILVATKCDLVRREGTANIARRFEDACSKWLESWVKKGLKEVRIEPGVSLTSCAVNVNTEAEEEITYQTAFHKRLATLMKGCMQDAHYESCVSLTSCTINEGQEEVETWSCDWGGSEPVCGAESPPRLQHRIIREPNDELRGANEVFPRSWDIAFTVLDALGEGRNPILAARKRLVQDGDEQAGPHEGEPYKGITAQQLQQKWSEVVEVLREEGTSIHKPDRALEWAMTIRESEGSIVRDETYVFLDVIWLAKILKPLLNHKDKNNIDGSITLGDIGDSLSPITLTSVDDIRSWETFKEDGILKPRLAKAVWGDLLEYVLPTLAHLGLTLQPDNDSAEGLVVLLRLPIIRPHEVGEEMDDFRKYHDEVFRVRWKMSLGVPPGAIEKVLARCCRIGVTQTFWRFGVLVRGGLEYGRFALVVEYDNDDKELEIGVYGNFDSSTSWAVLSYALSAVRYMTLDFLGLPWRAWLDCPQPRHDGKKHEICVHATRPGHNLLHDSGCNRCHPEIGGLGVAAVKLIQMVDIDEDKDKIFLDVEKRFSQVRDQFKELFPEELRAQRNSKVMIRTMTLLNGIDPEFLREMRQIKSMIEALQRQQETMSIEWSQMLKSVMESVVENYVMGPLDLLIEIMMAGLRDKVSAPRMACVLPPWEFTNSQGLTEEEMAVERWTERYGKWREGDFKEGKGFLKTEMRLFLLCAHSKELVPCGHEGHGYRVVRSRKWVRQTARLADVLYTLASTALPWGPVAGAIANTIWTTAMDYAEEKTAVGGEAKLAREIRNTPIPDNDLLQHGLKGETYDDLRKFVHEMEFRTLHDGSKESQSFNCFENVMVQVQARSGDANPQWVLKKNEQAWLDAH